MLPGYNKAVRLYTRVISYIISEGAAQSGSICPCFVDLHAVRRPSDCPSNILIMVEFLFAGCCRCELLVSREVQGCCADDGLSKLFGK